MGLALVQDLSGEAQDEPGSPAGSETPGGSDDGDFDKYLQVRINVKVSVPTGQIPARSVVSYFGILHWKCNQAFLDSAWSSAHSSSITAERWAQYAAGTKQGGGGGGQWRA